MKKIILLLLVVSLIFSVAGCSKNTIEEYSSAVKKTSELKKAEATLEISINNEFDTANLTEQGKILFRLFEDIVLSSNSKTDKTQKKFLTENSLKVAGTQIDFNILFQEGKSYIEFINPIISNKKYIEFVDEDIIIVDEEKAPKGLSQETLEKIRIKWLGMVNDENIFKGENILISTEAGEVKAREYTINIEDEQFRELALYAIDTFIENEDIRKSLGLRENTSSKEIDSFFSIFKYRLEKATDLRFNYKVYIDMDGYIVEENMEFTFKSDNTYGIPITKSQINITSLLRNVGKTPVFDIEKPNENNTINIRNMDINGVFNKLIK